MPPALLDTDILSEIFKRKNANVARRAAAYLGRHRQFSFSAFTLYEVLRGLKDNQAVAQLQRFEVFCRRSLILDVSRPVLERASDLWPAGRQGGHPHKDADLIIAATALEHGRVLITGNTRHFAWIPGLAIDDWR